MGPFHNHYLSNLEHELHLKRYQPGLISWGFHISTLHHSTSPMGNCALWDLFCHHNLTQCFLLGFPSTQLVDGREEDRATSVGLLSCLTAACVRFHTYRGQSTKKHYTGGINLTDPESYNSLLQKSSPCY